ncbi:hypothetical protein AVEN_96767-1 [Araneus ventricosus]|uniref:DDE Tnp4 domain-containing protein n=1 Tax=Araneus ventricosus TaxID=182803 RepID=A0A4Y2IN67_ARAVE|nr:hypothetical protein AVEN_96767-1 [Araneus ventricosus]
MEKDMANYMQHKLQGGNIHMKKDVVPHIFKCQMSLPATPIRQTGGKRRRLDILASLMDAQPTASTSAAANLDVESDASVAHVMSEKEFSDKSIQVSLKAPKVLVRSKATNTRRNIVKDSACSPLKIESVTCGTSPIKKYKDMAPEENFSSDSSNEGSDDSYVCSPSSSDSIYSEQSSDTEDYKKLLRTGTILAIEKKPFLNLGVPKECFFIVSLLSKKTNCPHVNVLITLKKIRLNDPYAILAQQFGMSESNICRIFKETVRFIAIALQELIIWPDARKVRERLPIAFRARYAKVQSIIDCFEIEIEKPSNPIHQALTWSEYKKANTLKYLISCTPDGLVNFISKGYGGRTDDTVIVEDSGYLEKLSPDMEVMADRGFKNISSSLQQRECKLVRPPSVSADIQCTPDEVKASKRIAALRIHVERLIRRVREFKMLLPHACIDNHLVQSFDYIVITTYALINMQSNLIRY